MVSLGGCGQQAAGNTEFRDQSNWQQTADDYGLVVAIPNAPGGGVLAYGCWDYYGVEHSRDNRHGKVSDTFGRLVRSTRVKGQSPVESPRDHHRQCDRKDTGGIWINSAMDERQRKTGIDDEAEATDHGKSSEL